MLTSLVRDLPFPSSRNRIWDPRGLHRLECFNQGSFNEFSSPVKMLSGSIVWTCVGCTFGSLVPLLSLAGFFLKVSQSCLVKGDRKDCKYLWFLHPEVINTSQPMGKRCVYTLGELAINLLSRRIWVSLIWVPLNPRSWRVSAGACFAQSNRLFYAHLQNLDF